MHDDWGVRTDRWSGVRSEWLDLHGTRVHVLRTDGAPDVADATPQLLLHGLGGSATNWIEVAQGLSAHGPVIAPDLPGFGRTQPPHARAARLSANTRFVRALCRHLELDRVVVHGNSMGGMLGVLLAELEPDRIERLVLVDPALPAPLSAVPRMPSRTLGRFAPFVVPPVGRALLGRAWDRYSPEQLWADNVDFIHGDGTRLSAEIAQVGTENLAWGRQQPWRLDAFAAAAASVVGALTVGSRRLLRAVDEVEAPALLVWGDADQLVGRAVIEAIASRRPDWQLEVFETVGHAPQVEVPERYLDVVAGWYHRQAGSSDAVA